MIVVDRQSDEGERRRKAYPMAEVTKSASQGLVVYIPGLDETPDKAEPLLKALAGQPAFAGFNFLPYPRPVRRFERGNLGTRGDELEDVIDEHWRTLGRPEKVVLIGHSIGGLLVRHAYLAGLARPGSEGWADRVTRVVLLAAPNRGQHLRRLAWWKRWGLGIALSIPPLARRYVGTDAVLGAPYLADLRLRWIRTMYGDERPTNFVITQVVGHDDSLITVSDSTDIETMPNSRMVGIAFADHETVINPSSPFDPSGEQFGRLVNAVTGADDRPNLPAGGAPSKSPSAPSDIVFLLHGIRSNAFGWVRELGDRIEAENSCFRVQHPSYGYLPAFNFAMPFGHDRQLRKFADWYTEQYSKYPGAKFHFAGHSNGTYILGHSLRRIPSMRFERVYLGGSVLPTNYAWAERSTQVKTLVNVCGTSDVPVGILCSLLHGMGRGDLGTGGFAGFDNPPQESAQWMWVRGGHGAAFTAERLPAAARFILAGRKPRANDGAFARNRKRWWRTQPNFFFGLASRLLMIVAPFLAAGALVGLILLAMSSWTAATITVGSLLGLITILRAL